MKAFLVLVICLSVVVLFVVSILSSEFIQIIGLEPREAPRRFVTPALLAIGVAGGLLWWFDKRKAK